MLPNRCHGGDFSKNQTIARLIFAFEVIPSRRVAKSSKLFCLGNLLGLISIDADYPYPKVYKVYSDFCYQKSIWAILSGVLLERDDQVA